MIECHIALSNSKTNSYLASCKDACKHRLSGKARVLKMHKILLSRERGTNNSKRTNPPTHEKYTTRLASSIKRKLDWTAEETGSTSKK